MWNKRFEGWYFKHQKDNNTIAFIPGKAESGAFIMMIDRSGSRHFEIPDLEIVDDVIYAGDCVFSPRGITINLPGVTGNINYTEVTPLKSDIMGPFRFFPMECRHGVLSMRHILSGHLTIDGKKVNFDNGLGYIEKDSGCSFPSSYLWMQCNDFAKPCSIMVSIAHIPFAGISFTGCICAITYGGREFRLATYQGVHIHAAGPKYIRLSQGKLLLEINIKPSEEGHSLSSPIGGKMAGTIRESHQATISCRLWESQKLVFALRSKNASYEYVPQSR